MGYQTDHSVYHAINNTRYLMLPMETVEINTYGISQFISDSGGFWKVI